jgi:hypothetical protein
MNGLKALQESFQRGVLAGDDSILNEIKGSAKESRDVLLVSTAMPTSSASSRC